MLSVVLYRESFKIGQEAVVSDKEGLIIHISGKTMRLLKVDIKRNVTGKLR